MPIHALDSSTALVKAVNQVRSTVSQRVAESITVNNVNKIAVSPFRVNISTPRKTLWEPKGCHIWKDSVTYFFHDQGLWPQSSFLIAPWVRGAVLYPVVVRPSTSLFHQCFMEH